MDMINRQTIKFGLFADAHYANNKVYGDRYCSDSLNKITQCANIFNERQVDFTVNLGDLIDSNDHKASDKSYLRDILNVYSKFDKDIYNVLGNHDIISLTKKEVIESLDEFFESSFYTFNKGHYQFIVLDANFNKDGDDWEECGNENYDWTDSNISTQQKEWLFNELQKAKDKKIIIFTHGNLDYRVKQGKMDPHIIRNAYEIREIIEKAGKVIAVIQGHYHTGYYQRINTIPYITIAAMVTGEGIENNSYAIVTIDKNKIIVEGFGKQQCIDI